MASMASSSQSTALPTSMVPARKTIVYPLVSAGASSWGWSTARGGKLLYVFFPYVKIFSAIIFEFCAPFLVCVLIVYHYRGSTGGITGRHNPMVTNCLGTVIRGLKARVTRWSNQNGIPFGWQARFYDRIVRNQTELNNIAEYIEDNVVNWQLDEMNT